MSDQHRPQLDEIAVGRVLDFDDAPGVLATSDLLPVDVDHGVGADDSEGDRLPELLDLLLVVFVLVAVREETYFLKSTLLSLFGPKQQS